MNKRILGVGAAAAAALLLASCSNGPASNTDSNATDEQADELSIVVAQYSPGTEGYWKEIIADFNQDYPDVKVDLQVLDWGNLQPTVNTLIQTKQYPDILNLTNFQDYAAADLLYTGDEVLTPEIIDDLLPAFRANGEMDGRLYGLPFVSSANTMYYNEEILAEAGIDVPTTFDELRDACNAINKLPGDIVTYALSLGATGGTGNAAAWVFAGGGEFFEDGEWTINSETNVETFQFLQNLAAEGCTQPNAGQSNTGDGTWPLFAQGKAAMTYAPLGDVPGFMDPVKEAGLSIAATTHPTNNGAEPTILGIQDNLMAFKKPGNQQLVQEILKRFYEPERYAQIAKTEGLFALTQSALDVSVNDEELGLTQADLDLLNTARFYPNHPGWAAANGRIKSDIGLTVDSGADVAQILTGIQDAATAG
ncbi:extracellular solute-binding protein [Microbacterium sp. YY-01]|uniref:extracellular solute-binding protein n=1 Tax=Microbacterium sp. YY-01 TaxID=3421634 RepID=UPI003D187622